MSGIFESTTILNVINVRRNVCETVSFRTDLTVSKNISQVSHTGDKQSRAKNAEKKIYLLLTLKGTNANVSRTSKRMLLTWMVYSLALNFCERFLLWFDFKNKTTNSFHVHFQWDIVHYTMLRNDIPNKMGITLRLGYCAVCVCLSLLIFYEILINKCAALLLLHPLSTICSPIPLTHTLTIHILRVNKKSLTKWKFGNICLFWWTCVWWWKIRTKLTILKLM